MAQLLLPRISLENQPFLAMLLEGMKSMLPSHAVFRVFAKSDLTTLGSRVCYSSLVPILTFPEG